MLTRTKTHARSIALAAIAFGLVGNVALADEEVVVYGDDVVARVRATEAEFQARMEEFARSMQHVVKANVAKELAAPRLPEIRLALSEASTRG